MFYKFLSDKEVDQLKKEGWTKEDMKEALVEEDEQVVGYCQRISATSSHTRICSRHGLKWGRILMFPMSATPYRHLIA